MASSSKSIHDIDIRNLREAKDKKRLVVFVGAGASIPSGYPSWREAVEKIAENLPSVTKGLDLLRIPQYYYNERGRNEYEKFMRKIFHHREILPIHEIHKEIIKLGASVIVTTNYDNLIERAFDECGVFLDVIAEDKDIPYKNIGHTLIKMHGDFEHHNFVLKEDDYLHYSQNFKLIETLLKSIIATNTLLFIGYSFNDPDTKQIFAWIKEILGENMQRAYMLDVSDNYNELNQKYYRNLGINVIYTKEIHKSVEASDLAVLTLKDINTLADNRPIDLIYNYLKPFEKFNYVYKDYIEKAFQKCGFKLDDNKLVLDDNRISPDDAIFDLLKNEEEIKRNARLNYINEILKKSFVKEISTPEKLEFNNDKTFFNFHSRSLGEYHQSSLANYIIDFDYEHIEELADASISKDAKITQNELLYKAFLYYKLEKYPRSYELLKQSAMISLRNRDYAFYFLSEFNRMTLGRIISNSWLYKSELRESVRNDLKKTDLNQIFQNLPNLGNDNNEFLRDLYTSQIVYSIFHKSYNTSLEVHRASETLYLCYNQSPEYEMFYEIVRDFWLYEVENCIIYRYSDVKPLYNFYIATIIKSISVPEKKREDPLFKCTLTNVKVSTFKVFDIFLIIEYSDLKELRQIFKKFKVPTNAFDTECIEYLIKIIPNILKIKQNTEYLEKAVFLTQYVQMNSRLLVILLKILPQYLSNEKLIVYICNIFTKIKAKKDVWNENKEEIRNLLLRLIQYVLESLVKSENKCNQNHCALLEWGLYFYRNRYGFFSDAVFNDFIFHATDVYRQLELLKCYQYVDKNKKKKIRAIFSNWDYSLNTDPYNEISIYKYLVYNKIKKNNPDFEEKIIEELHQIKGENRYSNDYEAILHVLINMYLSENFSKKNEFKEYIENNGEPFHKWIIDVSNFDYQNFKLKWVKYIRDEELLNKIAKDSIASKKIIDSYKEVADKKNLDKQLTKIYFRYFVN